MRVEQKSKIQDSKYNEFDKFNADHKLIHINSSEVVDKPYNYIDVILYNKNGKIIPQCRLGFNLDERI